MIRIPGKIPVIIHPTFFLIAGLIGYLNSLSLMGTLIWIGIILVSVLFHEFGHALTAKLFGLEPRIELVALGGLTYHEGGTLPPWKQFLIVFNGPFFGFLLFVGTSFLLLIPGLQVGVWSGILRTFRFVNLFWTILNLMPVLPLDGGHLLRVVLEKIFGAKGLRYALASSMVIALSMSLISFLFQAFLIGAIFFLFAFSAFDAFRKTKHISEPDRSSEVKEALDEAEMALEEGRLPQAEVLLEKVRAEAKRGMSHTLATQYLGILKYEKGQKEEAYRLLCSVKEDLSLNALCILHRLAFDQEDYPLVVELSGRCYQLFPGPESAIRNAFACANQKQSKAAVGWLHTAFEEGVDNLNDIIQQDAFNPIRQDPIFKDFTNKLKKA